MDDPQHQIEPSLRGPHRAGVAADRLTLGLSELARGLGYRAAAHGVAHTPRASDDKRPMPPHMAQVAEAMLAKGRELLEPQWLWVVVPATIDCEHDVLWCHAPSPVTLSVGRLVRAQLTGSQALAAFVVTIGARLETLARERLTGGQPLEGYLLDTVGSLAVEAAADVLEKRVAAAVADRGWTTTNRFSPGYCTWETGDQQSLFALFPERPAGIVLSESSLMSPLKSVSGMIGLGEGVKHRPYPCELCSMTNCRQRLTESRL